MKAKDFQHHGLLETWLRIQVHCYAAYIQQCLLLEQKRSRKTNDIQYVSARKSSSVVHTHFTTDNSKEDNRVLSLCMYS